MKKGFLLFSTIFCNVILDFCVKTRTRFSLRDKRLFEIIEVEITRVDCIRFRLYNHKGKLLYLAEDGITKRCISFYPFINRWPEFVCPFGRIEKDVRMSSWLVGCFGFNGPLRQYFSLYRTISQRD